MRNQVLDTMKFMSIDYCTNGALLLNSTTKKICSTCCIKGRKDTVQKKATDIISNMPQDFTVAVEDESIFIHDVLIRRKMWTPQQIRPTVTITGSHQKTCVFSSV